MSIPVWGYFGGVFITVNERIAEMLHTNKELTQKQLAHVIGVASSTVNNWIKLGRSIPAEFIIPISEFLNVSCDYLLTGKEKCNPSDFSNDDIEWISLIHQLPPKAQYEFRGEIKGYLKRLNEESVAADETLKKTGTENMGK